MDLQPNKSDAILKPITNTRISASEWNQLVGSCMAFISAAGFSPDASDNEQFLNAFKKIASELELIGANTALSNLTSEGQGKFDAKANVSLDNLSSAGKSLAAGLGMPLMDSSHWVPLNIAATGANYTMPEDGLVCFDATGGTIGGFILLSCGYFANLHLASQNYEVLRTFMFIPKGYTFKADYANAGTIQQFGYYKLKGNTN